MRVEEKAERELRDKGVVEAVETVQVAVEGWKRLVQGRVQRKRERERKGVTNDCLA
jgi:hypothetical protein